MLAIALSAGGCSETSERSTAPAPAEREMRAAVSPQHGGRHTPFTVSITTRAATGVLGRSRRGYHAEAHAVNGGGACVTGRDRAFPPAAAGRRVRATLDTRRGEGGKLGWCRGLFRGTITYVQAFACPASGTCRSPEGFANRAEVVARFTFRVRGVA